MLRLDSARELDLAARCDCIKVRDVKAKSTAAVVG
jgi:hypothetical protein